jgi:uncharacterized radical SAM superfamily Fe-S cluster-containing enzyme
MTTLRATTARCRICNESHPAEVVVRDGKVLGLTHCPKGTQEVLLSSNPALYERITNQSPTQVELPAPPNLTFLLNYLSITSSCNFRCTVCATNAGGPGPHVFLSLDDICQRARRVREQGARVLHLFGGEPTLHPELPGIIRRLTEMGLSVGLVSNGLLLGQRPALAAELKACGLKRVCLQFDSFAESALNFLGRNHLAAKQKAIENVLKADLHLGLNCTTTRKNLPELQALLKHGLDLGLQVRNMTFGTAAPVGRFDIAESDSVDREEILSALTENRDGAPFSLDDVRPMPAFLPWGLQVHPDCGVHILLLRSPRGVTPLNRYVHLDHLSARMGRCRLKRSWWSTRVVPLGCFLASLRPLRLPGLLRHLFGLWLRPRHYGLLNIGISDYRGAQFLDEQRLSRCASAFHTSTGPVSGCLHFYLRDDVPGSLAWEASHGSC